MEATSGEKWGFVGVGNMGKGTITLPRCYLRSYEMTLVPPS
jgi:hypothetical protein